MLAYEQLPGISRRFAGRSPVRGFLHGSTGSPGDWLVLTHGAGANCDSPLIDYTGGCVFRFRLDGPPLRSAFSSIATARAAAARQCGA